MGILNQELLWTFRNFDTSGTGDADEINSRRDELVNYLEKLLHGDNATVEVQKKVTQYSPEPIPIFNLTLQAYNILCDLLIVFRPGMKGNLQQFPLHVDSTTIPQTLLKFFNQEMTVESQKLPVKKRKEQEKEGATEKEKAKKKGEDDEEDAYTGKKGKGKGKGKEKAAEEDKPKGKKGKGKGKEKETPKKTKEGTVASYLIRYSG